MLSLIYECTHDKITLNTVVQFKIKGRAKFTSEDWKKFREVFVGMEKEDIDFGEQPVEEIQLLHMMLPKDQNGSATSS